MRSLYRGWVMREIAILEHIHKLVLTFSIALISISCTELSEYDSQQVQAALNDSLITTTESWDVEISLMRKGRIRMIIDGSHSVQYQSEENKRTTIDGPVYVQLFDTTGNLETEAWSKEAIYYDDVREFELLDSVRVQTVDDRQLYTDYLKYIQDSDRISSPQFVTIITPTDSISGRGFSGLTDLTSYTITEPRGRLIVE
ncbi:LPS export ABC transporter periplasmic protein LptC [Rhodohalobacter sulfatireducens]|uniref:LPS export ABC transporter periplasmic protein LptC n=1 Tax=Rhodohalobacter sulfatireducens TaxID=2911366 RepID=A0ABS9KDQ9_9BACT|nr:LPS export ABC transporter periplasmic protein LptC [Rhodohalobacter sulfatireducens]MCG2588993.1 LPS export ABC transporter periplasmic protein LptC [Rhodohalobacter sulfatireducens]